VTAGGPFDELDGVERLELRTGDEYLHDGVVVRCDGVYLELLTQRGDGLHRVMLDAAAYAGLRRYAARHGFE
jgi:hypothetical protein